MSSGTRETNNPTNTPRVFVQLDVEVEVGTQQNWLGHYDAVPPKTAHTIWQRPGSNTRSVRWFTQHLSFELPQSNLKATMSVAPVNVIKWKLSSTH